MSGPGTGIASQIAFGDESAYGTAATVDHFVEFDSEDVEYKPVFLQGEGLHGGGFGPRAARRVLSTMSADGPVSFEYPYKGVGLLWKHILGSTPTFTPAGTGAYKQVHQPGSVRGYGFTYQKGVPQTDGTNQPFTFSGGKIADAEFSVSDQQIAKMALTTLFKHTDTTTSLAAASYLTDNGLFTFRDAAIKIGGTASTTSGVVSISGGAAPATLFTGFSLKLTNPFDDKRYGLGNQGEMSEPLENALKPYTGQLDGEFTSRSEIWDVMKANTPTCLQVTFTSTTQIASSGSYFSIDFVLPCVFFDTASIGVAGPDVVKQTVPFTVLDDEANARVQVTITSSDSAI